MNTQTKWERFLREFSKGKSPQLQGDLLRLQRDSTPKLSREFKEGLPRPKGFPWEYIKVMGRPKKLRDWGFRKSEEKPGRVVKIL